MILSIFLQTFYLVFLVLMSVGPGFLTIANIAMTRGYKTSACAVCGCIIGDCIYITIGAFCAKEIVNAIPEFVSLVLSIVAVLFLLYLAYKFWKTDVTKLKTKQLDTKNGLSLALLLFLLKLSSPICIIGYSIIFTNVVKDATSIIPAVLGGCTATFVANAIMVTVFGTIGQKINTKILSYINKFSSLFIGGFATILAVKIIATLIK